MSRLSAHIFYVRTSAFVAALADEKRKSMRKSIYLMSLAVCVLPASAGTLEFSYSGADDIIRGYGRNRAETLDVAVRLADPVMAGKRVTGIKVPVIGDVSALSEPSGFISTELRTRTQNRTKVNDPDVCSVAGSIEDGVLSVTFDEPYEITETGVYVGYSLTVTDDKLAGKPAAVTDGEAPDGFWFHSTSSSQKWTDVGSKDGIVSAMTVILEGDFPVEAACVSLADAVYVAVDEAAVIPVMVKNQGSGEIASLTYRYTAGDVTGENTYELSEPIAGKLGVETELMLPAGTFGEEGKYALSLSVVKVNGEDNPFASVPAESELSVLPFVPVNRPLVEEYTGLECGWCPSGYVVLREMSEEYGSDFVAMAYHSRTFEDISCMVCLEESQFPYAPPGYPASQINRAISPLVLDIPKVWKSRRTGLPAGDITIDFGFREGEEGVLVAEAGARFLGDSDNSRYTLSFALVADGLSDPSWGQHNAYGYESTDCDGLTGEWWDLFVHTEERVYGLEFDDVVVYYPDVKGIDGSLPSEMESGVVYSYEFVVRKDDVRNLAGGNIVSDFNKTRVVGMIIDRVDGTVVNCVSSGYPHKLTDSVGMSPAEVVRTVYYDLQGRTVTRPEGGVFIKSETLSDGSVHVSKVIVN